MLEPYQNSGIWSYQACKFSWDDLNSEVLAYECVQLSEYQEQKALSQELSRSAGWELLKKNSCHEVATVWAKSVPMPDNIHDINHINQSKLLHTVAVGIAVYIMNVIKESLNDSVWIELDFLNIDLYHDLKRNSDRDYYASSLDKGATETVKQGALENIGHLLSLAALCSTDSGTSHLDRKVDESHTCLIQHTLIQFLTSIF